VHEGVFACAICSECYEQKQDLTDHLVNHTNSLVTCEGCNLCFPDAKRLKTHVGSGHKKPRYCCGHCEMRFVRFKEKRKHIASEHPRPRKTLCEFCGLKLTKKYMKLHVARMHKTKSINVECQICHNVVVNLKHHMNRVHEKPDRKYSCNHCCKRFYTENAIKAHMETHDNIRRYPCSWCGKSFKRDHALRTHIRIHTGQKPLQCKVCLDRFTQGGSLNYHMKSKHPEQYEKDRILLGCTKASFSRLLLC